jgi:hypothetical protein
MLGEYRPLGDNEIKTLTVYTHVPRGGPAGVPYDPPNRIGVLDGSASTLFGITTGKEIN